MVDTAVPTSSPIRKHVVPQPPEDSIQFSVPLGFVQLQRAARGSAFTGTHIQGQMEAAIIKVGYFTQTGTTLMGHICSSLPWTWLRLCWPALQFHLALPILLSASLPLVMILNKHLHAKLHLSVCFYRVQPTNKHSRESLWGSQRSENPSSGVLILLASF